MIDKISASTVIALLLCSSCAVEPSRPNRDMLARETPRTLDVAARPDVLAAAERLKAEDPDASFTFFNGHVDSFATAAKPTVPDYALPTLRALGLPTEPRTVRRLGAPTSASAAPRPARDLDRDLDTALPILPELELGERVSTEGYADEIDEPPAGDRPIADARTRPAENPQRMLDWDRPDERRLALERRAASSIVAAFLAQHVELFEVGPDALRDTIEPVDYQASVFFRKAAFEQRYSQDEKILYGRLLVHFDDNWNVIGISRMIATPDKLPVPALAARAVDERSSIRIAAGAFPPCAGREPEVLRAERAVDPVRRLRVWDVELLTADGECHWRTIINAADGRVLNVTDLIDRSFTDAKVNRWYFPGGDQFDPRQMVSSGIYTRNDRRLEHDFFYVMNDHRCEGAPEASCAATPHASQWCEKAHGTVDGESFVRATRRTNRDFDQYYPAGASETFGETNAYYWARAFSQWLKPSLNALGVLPGSASDYPRVLMITNACRTGSVHNASYQVTTEENKGEGTNVIRLAHRNPSGSSGHNFACQGGACFDNPSNLQHEMNHFYLRRYYDVGSDLDCAGGNQLKFTHEGMLGTAVPQAHWHYYYGVGYQPPSTDHLYFSNSATGRVHTDSSNNMTVDDYLCVDNTGDPYRAGRVAGQALWEFYHGKKVSGSTIGNTWYPSTDTDFNILVYWAADLQASSTYKDRYEFANRLMEILDKHSNWSSEGKRDYCEIFEHHSLHWFINSEYCD